MTVRYRIVGTIHIDPQPGRGAAHAAVGEATLEHALLSLAVTDAMADGSAWRLGRRWQAWPLDNEERMLVPADLAALLIELQSEWDELEIG